MLYYSSTSSYFLGNFCGFLWDLLVYSEFSSVFSALFDISPIRWKNQLKPTQNKISFAWCCWLLMFFVGLEKCQQNKYNLIILRNRLFNWLLFRFFRFILFDLFFIFILHVYKYKCDLSSFLAKAFFFSNFSSQELFWVHWLKHYEWSTNRKIPVEEGQKWSRPWLLLFFK